ncbi:type III secretion system export apparatus subunit SctS [Coralloluteibacterium stylophorae]|uniref:Type III secretion system export apparatus subunit SctS n=1 Tax=Coralloluteibacterium stylophorae TaxID=1776034 RepID=A0A8J7VVR9_9GAMM|nr:type III secretion system export apparatus subunit SctS [Coralloluteibacterium stylophorae]MBS7458765.1 type III secretion system export apparatus subunit SctS [Coralloluteibacterium stylophorae]
MNEVLELTRHALWLILLLSAPPIVAASAVGLIVAFLQAATQLQEQTFSYTVKFIAIVITLFVTAALVGGTLYTFTDRLFLDFPNLVGR